MEAKGRKKEKEHVRVISEGVEVCNGREAKRTGPEKEEAANEGRRRRKRYKKVISEIYTLDRKKRIKEEGKNTSRS